MIKKVKELCGLALLACALGVGLWSTPARAQVGYDRPGGDYFTYTVRSGGDPALCASRCERDSRCRAWSFSYPRTKQTHATCTLKTAVPPRIEATCCVSGVTMASSG